VLKASEDATAWCLLAVVTDSFDNNWNHALINSGGSMPYVVFTLLGVRSLLARAKPFRLNNCALSEAGLVVGLALMALVT
jgi:hypothetical protein